MQERDTRQYIQRVEHVLLSSIIIDLDESEILDIEVVFHDIPCENLENVVGGSQNAEIFHRIPGELESVGHLKNFFQNGHEILVESQSSGFVGFGHHAVAEVAEAVLPHTEFGLLLWESRCPAEQDKCRYDRNAFHKMEQTAKIQNILHYCRCVICVYFFGSARGAKFGL